jgi:hypothetical protein
MKDNRPSVTSLFITLAVLLNRGDRIDSLPTGCLESQMEQLRATNLPFGRYPRLICNAIVSKIVRFVLSFLVAGLLEGVAFRKCVSGRPSADEEEQEGNDASLGDCSRLRYLGL